MKRQSSLGGHLRLYLYVALWNLFAHLVSLQRTSLFTTFLIFLAKVQSTPSTCGCQKHFMLVIGLQLVRITLLLRHHGNSVQIMLHIRKRFLSSINEYLG